MTNRWIFRNTVVKEKHSDIKGKAKQLCFTIGIIERFQVVNDVTDKERKNKSRKKISQSNTRSSGHKLIIEHDLCYTNMSQSFKYS